MNTTPVEATLITEFAEVQIRVNTAPGNQYVELHAPHHESTARLDAFQLELLARMGPAFLSQVLQDIYENSTNGETSAQAGGGPA